VTLSAPRSAAAEAYRVLRTSIQLGGVDKPIKSILVTSSTRAEGKSLTAANLAVVMAQGGLRTILVDGDLRKPFQHRLFGISNNDVGLTNSLSKPGTIDEFLRPTKVENLRLLTSGPLPPDPAELLGSERMRALKARLEAEVDMLIFDSPPCLPVADTAILARLLDRAILVVDVSHTRRKDALRAKEILHRAGARVLGVVLNRVHTRGADYYYYDAYTSHNDQPETLSDSTTTVPSSAIANWLRALVRH
jgi:capsular exopolysaccharide synthesis family protein